MLESYKKAYEQCADNFIVEDWRKMNKNTLINKYLEVEKDTKLANAYLSAIIVRYWGVLNKYYALSRNSVSKDTYYNWLVDAVLYTVTKKKWKDLTNKLYNDPNAPDKVMNRVLASERSIFYQGSNAQKRSQDFTLASLEGLQEECGDPKLPIYEEDQLSAGNIDVIQLVEDAIRQKEYLTAFAIDSIVNYDPFDREKGENNYIYSTFSKKKLKRHLRSLPPNYCDTFAKIYHADKDAVQEAINTCKEMPRFRLDKFIDKIIKNLGKTYEQIKDY